MKMSAILILSSKEKLSEDTFMSDYNYNYLMHITASNRKTPLDEEMERYIRMACEKANASSTSVRFKRRFVFEGRVDEDTLQIRLLSETATIATRTISSVTRMLIRHCPAEKLEKLKYNGSILSAVLFEESKEESNQNLTPCTIVQTVVEIFFNQVTMRNKHKAAARKAAKKIKDIVTEYKEATKK